jgi:adenylate cyclase
VASPLQRQLLLVAMLVLGIAIAEGPSRIRRSAWLLALGVGGLIGAWSFLLLSGVWIGVAMPLAGLILFGSTGIVRRGAISQHHQQEIRRLLGQATSPAVAQQLWNQRAELIQDGRFTGREQAVTILFSDTCGFTQVSEQLSPAKLMEWLNQGMAISVDAVTNHGGMVNKFTGDGMLAVFGAPISAGKGRDAAQALAAARSIQTGILDLNKTLKRGGSAPLRLRIGIHSGVVLTGSLGSRERLEYAVIGDTVNCASRLESVHKERHQGFVRVLVSSTTLALADESLEQPSLIDWGEVTVKGRQEAIRVFELGHDNGPTGTPPVTPLAKKN